MVVNIYNWIYMGVFQQGKSISFFKWTDEIVWFVFVSIFRKSMCRTQKTLTQMKPFACTGFKQIAVRLYQLNAFNPSNKYGQNHMNCDRNTGCLSILQYLLEQPMSLPPARCLFPTWSTKIDIISFVEYACCMLVVLQPFEFNFLWRWVYFSPQFFRKAKPSFANASAKT